MPDLPDSISLLLPILALAAIPVIVAVRGHRQIRRTTPPRAYVPSAPEDGDMLVVMGRYGDRHFSGVKVVGEDAGWALTNDRAGLDRRWPPPYNWHTRVPAVLLEPGRRPRRG